MDSSASWRIVPYDEPSSFKRVRVRDDARIRVVIRHLQADECVALLGPPHSEKSHLLRDVAAALAETGRFQPLHIDLWQARSHDEAAFFTSLGGLVAQALGPAAPSPIDLPDPRAFQHYLAACANASECHLALLIDHLQALPHDLVHSLLLGLRSAYMEREADAPRSLVAVVTGGMNLVGLSTGPTSPFNIAKPVVSSALTEEQTRALAEATLAAHGCFVSPRGLDRIVAWANGDRYLVPRLCAWSAELVANHRPPRVTCDAVERVAENLWQIDEGFSPIRAAIRMIEEDPDTMLDVLHLLDHGVLARSRSRQMPTRTGTDRLQLSGAVVLAEGCYAFANLAYRRAFADHLTTERVGHVLRIAGRWAEAIEYLAPRLMSEQRSRGAGEPLRGGRGAEEQGSRGAEARRSSFGGAAARELNGMPFAARKGHAASGGAVHNLQPTTRNLQHPARPQLLEAIVQSIYATDSPERAYELLADGLRLGFGLAEIAIYRAVPAQGRLERVYPRGDAQSASVDLHDPVCVEAQTFQLGNYALRGSADEARLVVALTAGGRAIGIVTVEHYVRNRDPHELPEELPDLLRFLQHAAGAMENVMIRAAYRRIGQAVLDAKALQPTVERVLETIAEALGCDYAVLYLADEGGRMLEMTAGVGRVVEPEWQAQARFALTGRHPAVVALLDRRILTARGSDESHDRAIVERFGLHKFVRIFLPLRAAAEDLGTLELGYATGRARFTEEHKRTLATFSDQVAIAVHNMLLLQRTDQALARKTAEIALGREIQLSLLPKTNPVVPGWQFAAVYQAARVVSGDFYDFCELRGAPPRLGIVIADVADKGVPAALFMTLSRTIIRTVALAGRTPASALMRANDLILADSQAELFLSAIYAVLETGTGRLSYANAGHNPPLWYHAADGAVTELGQRGIVLGAFEEIKLEDGRIDLAPGDVLVFYTDGVTEALNAEGEMFGDERLRAVVAAHAAGSSQELLWAITGALAGFVGETEQADDVTCVVVKRG